MSQAVPPLNQDKVATFLCAALNLWQDYLARFEGVPDPPEGVLVWRKMPDGSVVVGCFEDPQHIAAIGAAMQPAEPHDTREGDGEGA